MKKEVRNHVGRPTNEEVKAKRRKQILKVVTPLVVIALIIIVIGNYVNSNKLKGAVSNGCTVNFKTSDNKLVVTSTCDSNTSAYKLNILNSNNTFIAKAYYKQNDYGVSKTKTIKLSKGTYTVNFYSINKNKKSNTIRKTVTINGQMYSNELGLKADEICTLDAPTFENNNISSKVTCGKNAQAWETHLINKTTKKDKTLQDYKGISTDEQVRYGYSGVIQSKVDSLTDKYALRLFYKPRQNNSGISVAVVTSKAKKANYTPEYCDFSTSVKHNFLTVNTDCNDKYYVSRVYIINSNKEFLAKLTYPSKLGQKFSRTVRIGRGSYIVKIRIKDKNKNTIKNLYKVVTVPGLDYKDAFNLSEDNKCSIVGVKLVNNKIEASIKCGKNAMPVEGHLYNATTHTDKYLTEPKDFNASYGYQGCDSLVLKNANNEYAYRLHYKVKNDYNGVSVYITTSDTIKYTKATTTSKKNNKTKAASTTRKKSYKIIK